MEHIAAILTAINENKFAFSLILILTAVIIYGIRTGILKYSKSDGLQIGRIRELELGTIRKQMEYMNYIMDSTMSDIPDRLKEGLHYYKAKYIISKVKDFLEQSIVYNHIEDSDSYISVKQEMAYALVLKLTDDEWFVKEEFKKYLYDLIKKIYKRLYQIRNGGA